MSDIEKRAVVKQKGGIEVVKKPAIVFSDGVRRLEIESILLRSP